MRDLCLKLSSESNSSLVFTQTKIDLLLHTACLLSLFAGLLFHSYPQQVSFIFMFFKLSLCFRIKVHKFCHKLSFYDSNSAGEVKSL